MDLTYTSPIKFDFSPTPGSTVTFEFKAKGSKNRIKINITMNIFYKDPFIVGRVFLSNSDMYNIYTSTDDQVHTIKMKTPEFKNRINSYINISMEPPAGDFYQKVIIEDMKITEINPPPQSPAVQLQTITAVPSIYPKVSIPIQVVKPKKRFKDDYGRPNVICEGLMFGNSGFAKAMRNIAFGLSKNCNVKAIIHDINDPSFKDTEKGRRVNELRFNSVDDHCMWITMTHPAGVVPHDDYYSIGYVMFETYEFPDNFSRHLSKQNEIWTPSKFCKDSMMRSGLTNVHVIPLGVDTELFDPEKTDPTKFPDLVNANKKYKFLTIMGYSERKGVSTLVRAFAEEFKGHDDVMLYLKGGWYDLGRAKTEINSKTNDISDPPLIHLDFNIYPDNVLPSLYKACDCFVLPTKGEGFGLPIAEAMSMAMPTIATRWSGNLEFMNDDNSYLIDIEGLGPEPGCAWITPEYIGRSFAIPSKNHLKQLMRYVYEHREDAKQKGRIARKYIVDNYTWEKCCGRIYDRLNDISDKLIEN